MDKATDTHNDDELDYTRLMLEINIKRGRQPYLPAFN